METALADVVDVDDGASKVELGGNNVAAKGEALAFPERSCVQERDLTLLRGIEALPTSREVVVVEWFH